MEDKFKSQVDSVSNPARELWAVTPSNSETLPKIAKAIFVGGSGDISIRAASDAVPVVLKNVPAGMILPIRALQIHASGTTATDIVALI